jgi:hypothetical protein
MRRSVVRSWEPCAGVAGSTSDHTSDLSSGTMGRTSAERLWRALRIARAAVATRARPCRAYAGTACPPLSMVLSMDPTLRRPAVADGRSGDARHDRL